MSKHTPGPWMAKQDKRRWQPNFVESADAHIADILPCGINKKVDAEAEANAHLIAAAPDMLEALKAMVAADDAFRATLPADWEEDPFTAACHSGRLAIAKAEGRS